MSEEELQQIPIEELRRLVRQGRAVDELVRGTGWSLQQVADDASRWRSIRSAEEHELAKRIFVRALERDVDWAKNRARAYFDWRAK